MRKWHIKMMLDKAMTGSSATGDGRWNFETCC